jgi:prepilin-type N-terminal cleavage/methylation domain-containing protein
MNKQAGFTLIELAIVLVIIGLLLGGVLRGQELINAAKAKNIISDYKNAQIFIYGYQDKFKAIPGDDINADKHINGAVVANKPAGKIGNGSIDTAWNSSDVNEESVRFWEHVRLAGFATGPASIAGVGDLPTNAENGRIGLQSVSGFTTITSMTGTYVMCSDKIPGSLAKQVDVNLDDGETSAGSVRAVVSGTAGAGVVSTAVVDGNLYTVCMTF